MEDWACVATGFSESGLEDFAVCITIIAIISTNKIAKLTLLFM